MSTALLILRHYRNRRQPPVKPCGLGWFAYSRHGHPIKYFPDRKLALGAVVGFYAANLELLTT